MQNLGQFYVYEMSRFCGFLPGWKVPKNGLFTCRNLGRYFKEPHRYPFLIYVDNELAGFALIDKVGSVPETDWNMGEFFIVSKFQGKKVGSFVACQLFDQFPGKWEVMQIPENKPAILFWKKVIELYTQGCFHDTLKPIPRLKYATRVVLLFESSGVNRTPLT